MPTYPIEPDKLLAAADLLVPPAAGPGRPSYTAHRRAISTAYYAVFHGITAQVIAHVFPAADDALRNRARRWINHGDVRMVSNWTRQGWGTAGGSPPAPVRALLDLSSGSTLVDAATLAIAEAFVEIHEKRDQADYDHEAVLARAEMRILVETAGQVVHSVQTAETDASRLFFALIAMQGRIQSR